MSEWPGTLTRIDAIRIIENITDKEDPAWEWAVEDFYDEESDTFPTLYEVLQTLGVTEAEYKSATNEQNTNWPEVSDELYISQQVRIDSLESELSTLKAERGTAFKAGYHLGHDHTVEGYFRWCDEGSTEVYEDWTAAEEVNSDE